MIRNVIRDATVAVFVLLLPACPAMAFDAVLGRWDITVEGDDGAYPSWLEVRLRTETQLMAQFVGQFGSARYATAVTYNDEELEVRVPVQYERGTDDLVFTGARRGDDLVGMVKVSGNLLAWRGVRAPSLKRSSHPEWGDPVALIGDDLSGWRMRNVRYTDCWSVDGGILAVTPPCADIITETVFEDFQLQLEFRYPPESNSGVYLRGRYEVQIQDDYGKALDALRLGGVYGFIAPVVAAGKPAGQWQTYDIELVGRRLTVILNGVEIISKQLVPGITGGALDSNEGQPGPLMLQGDHGPVEYRNIVITPAR